ncbi:MAG: DUF6572 domain-containing protein [Syntrophobacteraceae bacterium]|jgi:hypothetical protein
MSIEQTEVVDFVSIDPKSGDVYLTISDHLPWDRGEGEHLLLLQDKINAYLRFIESGEMVKELPETKGRKVLIELVSQFPLSEKASVFFEKTNAVIHDAGFILQFKLLGATRVESGTAIKLKEKTNRDLSAQ